jgi:hypothetical protein
MMMVFTTYENKLLKEAFIHFIDVSYGNYTPLKKIKVK